MKPSRTATHLAALALATAPLPVTGASAAGSAATHLLDLEQARAAVEDRALRASARDADRQRIDIDGQGIRIDVRADCRRTADHVARCAWRSFVYVGAADDPDMTCLGSARAELVGSRIQLPRFGRRCLR